MVKSPLLVPNNHETPTQRSLRPRNPVVQMHFSSLGLIVWGGAGVFQWSGPGSCVYCVQESENLSDLALVGPSW